MLSPIKYIILSALAICQCGTVFGGMTTDDRNLEILILNNSKIDQEQNRIDAFDEKTDRIIQFSNPVKTEAATEVFINGIDELQTLLETLDIKVFEKAMFSQELHRFVSRISAKDYHRLEFYEKIFDHLNGLLVAIEKGRLSLYLNANIPLSISNISFYQYQPEAGAFLWSASRQHPDLIMSSFNAFKERKYATDVLNEAVKHAPDVAKRYLSTHRLVNKYIRGSKDADVRQVVALYDNYGAKSKVFSLLDEIQFGTMTPEAASELCKDQDLYFTALINIIKKEDPLASFTVENELEMLSLQYVRALNDGHEETNASLRFKPIQHLSAEQLYALMVYTKEEIFTSTFNGIYSRLKTKIWGKSGFEFIEEMGRHRFREFLALCGGFNRLNDFLGTMSAGEQDSLMAEFASNLEKCNDQIEEAIHVADLFAVLKDSTIIDALQKAITREFKRVSSDLHQEGMAIYGLLSGMFIEHSLTGDTWLNEVSEQYQLHSMTTLSTRSLLGPGGECIQQHFFYDDADGKASFSSFMDEFKQDEWKIEEKGTYIVIQSMAGENVTIYANKPVYEYLGQQEIEIYFEHNNIYPSIVVHRGHSYYAYKTISQITSATRVVILGSCGSYHQLSSVLERSPDAHIISSRQIGTRAVNDPLLRQISDAVRKGNDLNWPIIWEDVAKEISSDAYAMRKFQDYIPPHRNVSAIFIKAYQRSLHQ